ncbi:MAG: glycosyltransferase family 2 protein [Wenzhouxiangella sp.]
MPPAISLIIPNYNGAHHLADCLDSLALQTVFPRCEFILVDNASNDDSIALVARDYPWVKALELSENRGFSSAVNAGIELAQGEIIVLLNNDTRAAADWLEQIETAMNSQPGAAIIASRMLRWEPPHRIDSAGDRFALLHGQGLNIAAGQPADSRPRATWVPAACAGAAAYRRSLFEDIGRFDESFFLVYEDLELSLRALVAGHRCLYWPKAVVYHKRGVSMKRLDPETLSRSWRNLFWAAGQNLPPMLLAAWLLRSVVSVVFFAGKSVLARLLRSRPTAQNSTAAPAAKTGADTETLSDQPTGAVQQDANGSALLRHYWPAWRQAFAELAARRRHHRPHRRLGSLAVLARLIRWDQPLQTDTASK